MDWIEKLFGFSPDGGNGSTELVIVLALGFGAFVLAAMGTRYIKRLRLRRQICESVSKSS